MHPELIEQYGINEKLVNRFNAWRELTLGQTTPKTFNPEATSHYEPPAAGGSLETVIAEQMAWITAWRIDRYARGSMLKTPFYQRATNTEALPAARKAAEEVRDEKQAAVLRARQNQIANQPPDRMDELVLQPGVKDFDPKMDQTQLFDAAKEFGKDYHDGYRIPDSAFFAQTMKAVQPTRMGISTGLWQSLAPDLWAFYLSLLPERPEWKIIPDAQRVSQSRQVLLQQLGRRNAESTLYENMLKSVRCNFADVSLEDMTSGTDARRLFTTDEVVPGMFTRQAWEGGIQQAIDKAASSRREEIDWVLSDSRKTMSTDLSPEALKARLTRRYFTDFAGSWLNFLNSLRLNPTTNIADVTDQLTLISDVRQSPLIALMNTLAWQGQAGQQREGLSDSLIKSARDLVGGKDKPAIDQSAAGPQGPLDDTFGPLLQLMGKNTGSNVMSADSTLSLQTYLTRITRVRLRLQQVANASDPQEMMQTLAQTVFQGKSVDLTDTQQYGSLISASLGEEWSGFGNTLFVQPLTQAWETVLLPSAASLNDKWRRSVVANWHTAFDGRFPFAASKSDASLPMLAEFVRKDSGRIERFLTTELNGVLHKEGSQWVPDKVNSHGLVFNPAFLRAINQLSQLSDILFTDGSQGISFELQARPAPEVVETQLTIDGQKLRYFNQMADWQTFRWPGETYKPGTLLTWTTVNAGTRLFGDYSGTWGFIRWLEQGKRQQLERSQWMMSFTAPDGRTLQWVLRSQLGSGPLVLLALRGLTLPDKIFTVDAAESAQALTTGVGNSDMDEMEL